MAGNPFGKTLESDWSDPALRALSDRDYRIYDYLRSNRHRTLCGVYYLPIPTAAHELGKRQEDLEIALFDKLQGLVTYDPRTEEVWVHRLATDNLDHPAGLAFQARSADKPDKRLPGVRRSAEAIRSEWLKTRFLTYYQTWNLGIPLPGGTEAPSPQLTLVRPEEPLPRGFDGPSEGPPSPSGGASKPIAGSSKQVAGSNSSADGSYEPSGKPRGQLVQEAGQLMPLVREHFYRNGPAPEGYDDGRDFGILVSLLEQERPLDLAAAIEGLAMLRDAGELSWAPPRSKLTMRALYHTGSGVLSTLEAGRQHYHRTLNQQRGPAPLGAILARMRS